MSLHVAREPSGPRLTVRVAFVLTRQEPVGGAQVHVRDLSAHLAGQGHHVLIVCGAALTENGPFSELVRSRHVDVVTVAALQRTLAPHRDVRAWGALRNQLRQFSPDIVSTHSSKAGVLGRLAARSIGVPALFTAHGWAFADGVPRRRAMVYRHIERTVSPLASRIITVSEADREVALRYRIAPGSRLAVVHNGMPDIPKSLRADPFLDPPRMLMVARFQEQKDHATLFRALKSLKHVPWSLDLIGGGPGRDRAEEFVTQLGLESRVHFRGQQDDVAGWLASSQLFLLISKWEGFPRSILEAMRAGLPVIASDVGGCAEAVEIGSNGFLVRRGDDRTLAQLLENLLKRPELRAQLGAEGRRVYERRFTFEHMAQQTRAVYHDVLDVSDRTSQRN